MNMKINARRLSLKICTPFGALLVMQFITMNAVAQVTLVTPKPVVRLMDCAAADVLAKKIYRRIESARIDKNESSAYTYSRVFWDLEEQTAGCPLTDDAAKALNIVGLTKIAVAPSRDVKKIIDELKGAVSCPTIPSFKDCPNVMVIQGGSGNASGSEKNDLRWNREFQDRFKDLKLQEKSLTK
jgi:hypothetical protein